MVRGSLSWSPFRASLWLAALLLGSSAGMLSATADPQTIKIVGIGASSCTQYMQEIEAQPRIERDYIAWAQGYMSGLLVRAPPGKDEDLDLAPPPFPLAKQADFLRTFCSTHAGADFSDAVNTLYQTLRAPPG